MKWIVLLLAAVGTAAVVVASSAPISGHADEKADPVFGIKIPPGYRDWKLVSVAHEEGSLNDIRAILGNDAAINTYREEKLPFPDGTIIARIAWRHVASEENNKVFGRSQSFVPGAAPIGTCSLWSGTQKNTPRPEAGDTPNSIRTATLRARCRSKPAFRATKRSKPGTLCSPVTHLNTEINCRKE